MKTKFFFLFAAHFLFASYLSAQSWVAQNSNTAQKLWEVYFINPNKGFACGDSGTLLKTTDGGTNWMPVTTGVSDGLACIRFVNDTVGYVSGYPGGTLLKTTDGGNSWSNFSLTLSVNSGGSWFTSEDTGFIATGDFTNNAILKTTDGGINWDTVHTGTGWISYFYFPDAMNGYATVSGGNIYKTSDGGNTWSTSNVGDNLWMSGIYFFNKDTGFAGGGGAVSKIFKTTDGGLNWNTTATGITCSKIAFISGMTGYTIAADSTGAGPLKKTVDGGITWSDESILTSRVLGFYFLNQNLGYAVGENGAIIKYGMGTGIAAQHISGSNIFVSIFPNPFSELATLTVSSFKFQVSNLELRIYDMLGREAKQLSIVNNQSTIERNGLPAGMYFYKLTNEQQETIASGKLIAE